MTIQQYQDEINALWVKQNISKNSDHTDLDNLVMKFSLENNKSYFSLSALFLEFTNDQQKEESQEIKLNPEITNQISDCLDLLFINENETEGNECFIIAANYVLNSGKILQV